MPAENGSYLGYVVQPPCVMVNMPFLGESRSRLHYFD
jgi:hypothetical protein